MDCSGPLVLSVDWVSVLFQSNSEMNIKVDVATQQIEMTKVFMVACWRDIASCD